MRVTFQFHKNHFLHLSSNQGLTVAASPEGAKLFFWTGSELLTGGGYNTLQQHAGFLLFYASKLCLPLQNPASVTSSLATELGRLPSQPTLLSIDDWLAGNSLINTIA